MFGGEGVDHLGRRSGGRYLGHQIIVYIILFIEPGEKDLERSDVPLHCGRGEQFADARCSGLCLQIPDEFSDVASIDLFKFCGQLVPLQEFVEYSQI